MVVVESNISAIGLTSFDVREDLEGTPCVSGLGDQGSGTQRLCVESFGRVWTPKGLVEGVGAVLDLAMEKRKHGCFRSFLILRLLKSWYFFAQIKVNDLPLFVLPSLWPGTAERCNS